MAWSSAASVITKERYSLRGLTGEEVSLNTASSTETVSLSISTAGEKFQSGTARKVSE